MVALGQRRLVTTAGLTMTDVFEAETTVAQWDDDYYHPVAERLYDRAVADMLAWLRPVRGETVLDAGCGPGVHSVRVARAGFRVCAIDVSDTMLRHARRRVAAAGLADRVTFERQDLTRLGFADGSFRAAFSWGVVIHIPEAARALDELARVLAPGGRLALYLTNRTALDHKFEGAARWLLRRPLPGFQRGELGDGISYDMDGSRLWLWRMDTEAVARQLAGRGLRLVHRRIGELTEIQRRLAGLPRRVLLHANNAAWSLRLPPSLASTSLLVFEKAA
jgi:ubiquinone/menaquinone biosynthesis C-methylase UbiE